MRFIKTIIKINEQQQQPHQFESLILILTLIKPLLRDDQVIDRFNDIGRLKSWRHSAHLITPRITPEANFLNILKELGGMIKACRVTN